MYSSTYSTTSDPSVKYEALPEHDPIQHDNEKSILRASRRQWMILALVELVILLVTLWVAVFRTNPLDAPHSLVKDVIQYETRVFHTGYPEDRTAYIGRPSPKVDALWHDLIEGGIFKINKDEERMLVNRTSPLSGDGESFASSLAVVHHLHCLNKMRKSLWPEYYPESDVRLNERALIHQEHCIEILRQAHMCHPDLTAEVFQWDMGQKKLIIPADKQHICVNFNAIQQWMRKRAVYDDEFDIYSYVNGAPLYKPAHALSN